MAKINFRAVEAVLSGGRREATVGNNRSLERADDGYIFRLHGNAIVRQRKSGDVTFSPCGYPTVTTAVAMHDGATIFGLEHLGASFAKGQFRIRWGGVTYIPGPNGDIVVQQRKAEAA